MLRLYDFPGSGNSYKPYLLLHLLGRPFQHIRVDILKGETRTPEFLAKNPNGRIPVLEYEDGRCLAESNAILFHLAEGTPFLPQDAWERALVLQWMFFEQYSHEPAVAVLRRLRHVGPGDLAREKSLEEKSHQAFSVMEGHLKDRRFFVGEGYSIADIALFAYTHVAHEARLALEPYPEIRAWLERVRAVPGHVPMAH